MEHDFYILDRPNEIPKKYQDMLQSLLDDLEKETGKTLEITIKEFGPSDDLTKWHHTFGSINSRESIRVYNMKPEYAELEAYYDSKAVLIEQIERLKRINKFEKLVYFSTREVYTMCPICRNLCDINSNICSNVLCMDRTLLKISNIWDDVDVDEENGDIVILKHKELPKVIGHYEFVKN